MVPLRIIRIYPAVHSLVMLRLLTLTMIRILILLYLTTVVTWLLFLWAKAMVHLLRRAPMMLANIPLQFLYLILMAMDRMILQLLIRVAIALRCCLVKAMALSLNQQIIQSVAILTVLPLS